MPDIIFECSLTLTFNYVGIEYRKYDMSDWVDNCDAEVQTKAFKDAADIIDSIISKVRYESILVDKHL